MPVFGTDWNVSSSNITTLSMNALNQINSLPPIDSNVEPPPVANVFTDSSANVIFLTSVEDMS